VISKQLNRDDVRVAGVSVRNLLGLLRTRAFEREPVHTIARAIGWMLFYVLPRRKAFVSIPVGRTRFKLCLAPHLRHGSTAIFIMRKYYEPLLEYCERIVKPGDVVFDCGANLGIYSCAFAALAGESGHVFAFEPLPRAVAALRDNLNYNGFGNVTIVEAAVAEKEGTAVLDCSGSSVAASIVYDFGKRESVSVPTVSLSNFAARVGLERVDLVKMDIEGAEYLAVEGAKELIAKLKPTIILELFSGDENVPRVIELLRTHGYRPHVFNEQGALVPVKQVTGYHPDIVFLTDTLPERAAAAG
jgi:FkbM family methyltransferase